MACHDMSTVKRHWLCTKLKPSDTTYKKVKPTIQKYSISNLNLQTDRSWSCCSFSGPVAARSPCVQLGSGIFQFQNCIILSFVFVFVRLGLGIFRIQHRWSLCSCHLRTWNIHKDIIEPDRRLIWSLRTEIVRCGTSWRAATFSGVQRSTCHIKVNCFFKIFYWKCSSCGSVSVQPRLAVIVSPLFLNISMLSPFLSDWGFYELVLGCTDCFIEDWLFLFTRLYLETVVAALREEILFKA